MANIIITGANQGIGYYFTEQALKDGNKVAVLDVETDKLEALAQAFPKQLLYYNIDVCDEIQINTAVKKIIATFHFIDIAIHNACLCTFDNECSIDLDIYKQVFNVNYYGGLRLAKSVIPYMQAQKRGKIIFTSSGVGVTGFIGISPYASTKGALESLAKCLNIEYASDGISFHIKNSIFQNSLIFQGLPPVKYPNLMYFPLFLPLPAETRENFYASPTTLSKSLAEVRFASLVEWA